MIRHYKGRRYDTSKAILIGQMISRECPDAEKWTASIYRTPIGGRYFLHGRGGSLTIFGGREKIIPISDEQARAYAYEYIPSELYTREFRPAEL